MGRVRLARRGGACELRKGGWEGGAGLWPSDIIGGLLWGIGFFCEATADWQKLRFKLDPANKGRYINTGEASAQPLCTA